MAAKYGIFVPAACAGAKTIGMEILKQCVQGWKSHNYAEFRPFFIFGTLITDRVTGYFRKSSFAQMFIFMSLNLRVKREYGCYVLTKFRNEGIIDSVGS